MNNKVNGISVTKADLAKAEKKLTKRLDDMDKRFGDIDKRFNGVDKRFGDIDKRFDGVDKRFDAMEKTLRMEIKLSADNTKEDIKTFFTESVSQIMESVDVFMVEIKASREERVIVSHQVARCSERLDILEQKLHVAI